MNVSVTFTVIELGPVTTVGKPGGIVNTFTALVAPDCKAPLRYTQPVDISIRCVCPLVSACVTVTDLPPDATVYGALTGPVTVISGIASKLP